MMADLRRLLVVANTDWFLFNFMLAFLRLHVKAGVEVVVASPAGPYVASLQQAGLEWLELPMSRGRGTLLEAARLVQGLRAAVRRARADLLHLVTAKCVLAGLISLPHASGPGRINVLPGLGHAFSSSGLGAAFDRQAIRRGVGIAASRPGTITVFHQAADRTTILGRRGPGPDRSRLIPGWGVDLERFNARRLPQTPPLVMMISRMLWTKGVAEFVEAARSLRAETKARFVLVGGPDPGNPSSVGDSQIQAWVREGVVEWWGHQPDVVAVLRRASVCVLPSKYAEGVPQILLEAAALQVPMVATDIPGCREVVADGQTGLLVPPRDPSALAQAIGRILRDPADGERLGRNARGVAGERFSTERLLSEYLAVYRELGYRAPSPITGDMKAASRQGRPSAGDSGTIP